jgi:hypothetical protein
LARFVGSTPDFGQKSGEALTVKPDERAKLELAIRCGLTAEELAETVYA